MKKILKTIGLAIFMSSMFFIMAETSPKSSVFNFTGDTHGNFILSVISGPIVSIIMNYFDD